MLATTSVPLPLGIFELDAAGRVLAYSTYKSSLNGRTRHDIIGKNFFKEVAGDSASDLETWFERVYRDRIPFNKFYIDDDASGRRSILMMFFPDTHSVMVKVD